MCPILYNPMHCSMPRFSVLYYLPERDSNSNSCPLSQWCHPTISSSVIPSFLPSIFPASGSFLMSWLFPLGGQSVGASASALPMNIQDWFPLGLTGLIFLSKGLSRVFSSSTVQRHQFFGTQPFLLSSSHIRTWLPKSSPGGSRVIGSGDGVGY